jgi:sugar lactone lactonase YvrE
MVLKLQSPLHRRIWWNKKPQRFSGLVFQRTVFIIAVIVLGIANIVSITSSTTNATASEWYAAGWDKLSVGSAPDACGVSQNTVYCWGELLGSSSRTLTTPTNIDTNGVLTGKTITDISAAYDHSCAVADGAVYCWGWGGSGQLGDGSLSNSDTPVAVSTTGVLGGKTVTAVSANMGNTCALAEGSVYCWGQNSMGELGDGTTTMRPTPINIDTANILSGKTVTKLSLGAGGGCVIASGAPYCWNQRPGNNQAYGAGPYPIVAVDTSGVLNGKTITDIDAGIGSCAIADGKVYCWGFDSQGALGTGGGGTSDTPIAVDASGVLNGKTVTGLSHGDNLGHCAIADGKVYCWGFNANAQLGDGTQTDSNVPVAVDDSGVLNGKTVDSVVSTQRIGCALSGRTAFCWGSQAILGNGVTGSLVPVEVTPPTPTISSISHAKGTLSGGETMYVYGTYFDPIDANVFIGGTQAQVTYRYTTSVIGVTVPSSLTPGTVDIKVTNPDGREVTLQDAYTYTTNPIIDYTNQTTGLINSTINSAVQGENFDAAATVSVGGIPAQIIYQDSAYIAFTVPLSTTVKSADIVVTNPNGSSTIATTQFSYVTSNPPQISSTNGEQAQINYSPTYGYIYGWNFDNESTVMVRGMQAQIFDRAVGRIGYIIPQSPDLGPADVTVTSAIGESYTYQDGITYIPRRAPFITSISPDTVSINSSSQAYIYGNDFDTTSTVTVGGVSAQIGDQSSSHIHFAVPSSAVLGKVDVTVTNSDGQSTTLQDGIEYVPHVSPSISSVDSAQGSATGGSQMSIFGSNFNNPTVKIGGNSAPVNYTDAGSIIVTVPASPTTGLVDITVTNQDGYATTLTDGFEYTSRLAPDITSSSPSPALSNLSGGTDIYLNGTNFDSNATITVGGVPASIVSIYSTFAQITIPASSTAGFVDIVLTNSDGQSDTLVNALEYVMPGQPSISAMYGTQSTMLGGGYLQIIGSNFDNPAVTIGGKSANVTYSDMTYIQATVPSSTSTGIVDVVVTNQDGRSVTSSNSFEYVQTKMLSNQFKKTFGESGTGNGQFSWLEGITFDNDGLIYVTDNGSNRVEVFNPDGTYVRQFGTSGLGAGQIDYATAIKIGPDGNVYVLDSGTLKVSVFTKSGTYLRRIDVSKAGYPEGMAFNSKGEMYITDCGSESTLKVYNTDGTFLRNIGTDGSGDGQFDCSYAVEIDSSDNVYVADASNYRIQEFDKNDNFVRKFGSRGIGEAELGWVEGLTLDKFGNVLVVDSENDRIQVFDKTGSYLGQIGRPGNGSGQFDYPNSIAINQNGDLYVTDASNNRVQVFEGVKLASEPAAIPSQEPVKQAPKPTTAKNKTTENQTTSEDKTKLELEQNTTINGNISLTDNPVISKRPTFSGVAAPFAEVIVTIHSDPVICKTTADAEGKWSCTLDRDLPAGNHHVTIELTNQDGTKTTLGPYSVIVKGGDTVNSDDPRVLDKNDSKTTNKDYMNSPLLYLSLTAIILLSIVVAATLIRKRVQKA